MSRNANRGRRFRQRWWVDIEQWISESLHVRTDSSWVDVAIPGIGSGKSASTELPARSASLRG